MSTFTRGNREAKSFTYRLSAHQIDVQVVEIQVQSQIAQIVHVHVVHVHVHLLIVGRVVGLRGGQQIHVAGLERLIEIRFGLGQIVRVIVERVE